MNGSGLGLINFGPTRVGIFGQQPWQEEARRNLYQEKAGQYLHRVTGGSPQNATPTQRAYAAEYAGYFLPQGSTLGGGTTVYTAGAGSLVGKNVPANWWQSGGIPSFSF